MLLFKSKNRYIQMNNIFDNNNGSDSFGIESDAT